MLYISLIDRARGHRDYDNAIDEYNILICQLLRILDDRLLNQQGGARLEKVRLVNAEYGFIKFCTNKNNNNTIDEIKIIIGGNEKLV